MSEARATATATRAAGADGLDRDAWRVANAEWLAAALRLLRLRLHRHLLGVRARDADGVSDWLLARDPAGGDDGSDDRKASLDTRVAAAEQELDDLTARLEALTSIPAVRSLAAIAQLTDLESDLLLLAAATSLDGAFAAAFAEVHGDTRRDHATLQLGLSLFSPGPPSVPAADILLPGRTLRRLRLVTLAADGDDPVLLRRLAVDDRVADYLRGVNRLDDRLAGFLVRLEHGSGPGTAAGDEHRAHADGSSATDASATEIARRMAAHAEQWPTINVVGRPDAGSRQAAVLACERAALRPCLLDIARLAELGQDARAEVIALLGREAVLLDLAVVVDASRIDAGSVAAGVVDDVIRTISAPVLVLSPERWPVRETAIDVVVVRRPNRVEQRDLWRLALASHRNSVNGELEAIVQQFDFGYESIGEVVDRAARDADEAITGRDLWDACRVQAGTGLDDLARRIEPVWGWDDIVVEPDVRDQLRELADQVGQRGRVYEDWGFGAQLGRGRGITALFAGPSGTGKTMAAEIIARELRLDLYRIDLAGVVSKYVGETEKNLRRVFDAAEASGAILLFDEADALFGTRTEVRDSHDRYANLEINYLLQAMEDYAGLAILATNRRSALDTAFVRRLRFIVDFPFPAAEARREIWERAFPAAAELDGMDAGALARLELAGGSIRSIAINAAFLAAAEGTPIRMPHVIRAASREYAKLSRPIGAAEFGEWITVARR